jgi:hypothetical protein
MGAVNIFLGGTGKYIAADLESQVAFFGLNISEPIAFDLDASSPVPGVPVRGLVSADAGTDDAVVRRATEWAVAGASDGVGPAEGGPPGPRIPLEQSLLVDIGKGVMSNPKPSQGLYALRAHGLAVFSLLFDSAAGTAGTGAGVKLRSQIHAYVEEQRREGSTPRVNLVTSTAGGTGAGTVIPFALWLRRQYPECEITLVAVTPSAFEGVLTRSAGLEEIAAKGRSGTYALMRELSFLAQPDPQTARFSARHLPITVEGLEYRPGLRLFNRIYWFGRKGATSRDAFEEAALLVRILTSNNAASTLAGLTGSFPLQVVGSITAIEYGRLRLQKRLVNSTLREVYSGLRESPALPAGGDAIEARVSLLDYVDADTTRPLGAWFYEERDGVFAATAGAVFDGDVASSLQDKLLAEAAVGGWEAIPRGVNRRPAGYEAEDSEWHRYTASLADDLGAAANENQDRLTRAIRDARQDEESAFGEWLRATIFDRLLSGDGSLDAAPRSTRDARDVLDRLERQANDISKRIDHDELFRVKTHQQLQSEIRKQHEAVKRPTELEVRPSLGQQVAAGLGAAIVALVGEALVGQINAFTVGSVRSEWLALAAIVVAILAANRLALWVLLRPSIEAARLSSRRRSEEDGLFVLYQQLDRARAIGWMHHELRIGYDGNGPFLGRLKRQIRAARDAVRRLDEVYKGLMDTAAGTEASAEATPAHVRSEIGNCLEGHPALAEAIRPAVARRLRVEALLDPDHRVGEVRMKFVPVTDEDEDRFQPASASTTQLLKALAGEDGDEAVEARMRLDGVQQAAWELVNWHLGEHLPADFASALLYCADGDAGKATSSLAERLTQVAAALPRPPSVDLRGTVGEPFARRMFVGSAAVLAAVNEAITAPEVKRTDRTKLQAYQASHEIVPALGEQVVFLDLWGAPRGARWAPDVISDSPGSLRAQATYYGADGASSNGTTARATCFTVIPELQAATKIELDGLIEPLHLAVCARLLGSDPDRQGPTLSELYYLLRARGWIRSATVGFGPEAHIETMIGNGQGPRLRLVSRPLVALGGNHDLFGEGRPVVVEFDAFTDFMRFDGRSIVAGDEAPEVVQVPNARVHLEEWAGAPALVAQAQRDAVNLWYSADLDEDLKKISNCLDEDVRLMSGSECASDWRRAMTVTTVRRETWRRFIQ